MGVGKSLKSFMNLEGRRNALAVLTFEPQLARLGLSVKEIEGQDLDQLKASLRNCDDAISHPESFGTARAPETQMEVGILPLLLERKSLILARIKELVGDQKIESLKDLIANITDPQLKEKIERDVASLVESRRLAEQQSANSQAQAEQVAKQQEEAATLQASLFERRLRAWIGFLAKENVAIIIGAVLVLGLASVQVAAMIWHLEKSEIVNNAFLLILGFFFGQNTPRAATPDKDSNA